MKRSTAWPRTGLPCTNKTIYGLEVRDLLRKLNQVSQSGHQSYASQRDNESLGPPIDSMFSVTCDSMVVAGESVMLALGRIGILPQRASGRGEESGQYPPLRQSEPLHSRGAL